MAVETTQNLIQEYEDIFSGKGHLKGELELTEQAKPVKLPVRKIPLAVNLKLRAEIQRLVKLGIEKEPTDWISSMVVVMKNNKKIRLCIDPQSLNKVLKRNHYPTPTIEDVLPDLSRARIFSVVDAKTGFGHVKLDEESSKLTTFGTPWGRYRWRRMPFGIAPVPEEFQRRIDEALEGIQGVKAIHDDILVWGSGEDDAKATEDHNRKLQELFERCHKKNVKLNKDKMKLRQKEVTFMGHVISAEGLKVDSAKVEAIREMPTPMDKQAVQRLLGMANCVQKFAPRLSEMTEPLRQLIKKDVEFYWDQIHDKCLHEIREILTSAPVLRYFDHEKDTILQCDASEMGLRACLLQEGHPVSYASRALTVTEAVVYARHDSEELSLAYGNRSAAWFFLDKWKLCLDDITPALSPQCPWSSKIKLMLRKVQCFLKLGDVRGTESSIHEAIDWIKDVDCPEEKKKDSALQDLNSYEKKLDLLRQQQDSPNENDMPSGPPCLSYGINKVITQASSRVEMKYNLEQGRFLVATDDIKAGDTLIVERPFAAVLLPDHDDTHCHHCYGKLTTVVPCVQCCTVRYCSFQCREESWTVYHQVECSYLDILRSVGIAHLSLRVILTAGLQFLINFRKEYQEFCRENLSLLPGLDRDRQYARNYLTVFDLVTHTEDMNTSDLFQYSMTAVLLLKVLQHAQWFQQRNEEHDSGDIKYKPATNSTIKSSPQMCSSGDLVSDHLDHVHIQSEFSQPKTLQEKQGLYKSHYLSQSDLGLTGVQSSDIEVYIGGLLLRHIQQLVCNAHAITELQVSQVSAGNIAQVEETSQVRVATAIYPTASLMNHSCDPTIISSFCKDILVVRAVKDVPKGGEVFNCYGPHYRRMGWSQRQQSLKEQYFFTCRCQPCLTDKEQQSIFTAYRCSKCEDAVLETENSCACQGCGLVADKELLKKIYLEGEKLFLIGLDKLKQQNIPGAIEELLSCHKLWKNILYKYHQDLSKVLDCLSRCYAMQGHFKRSSVYLRESINIVSKMYGESSIEVANELHKFSEVLISARNWTEALSVAERAIQLFSLHYGESHSTVQELFDMKKQLQECMKM